VKKGSANRAVKRCTLMAWGLILFVYLVGCGESEPYTFGFIGGLSGRVSDLGGPARNGVLLAVEETNRTGGINGRRIEVIIKDDKQDPALARKAFHELLEEEADVILGPTTSAMAMAIVDLANQANILLMGITISTNELTGLDDQFLRGLSSTESYAAKLADYLYYQMGLRRFASVYDQKNKSYAKGWSDDFNRRFQENGGKRTAMIGFASGKPTELIGVAERLLEDAPDVIILATNSVDAALLAKLIRSRDPDVFLATSEWAGTERLIELGGRHVENAIVPQYLDRDSQNQAYRDFRTRFLERFNQEPGFPGLIAYNMTRVIIASLHQNPDPRKLKETILTQKVFPGIQGDLQFDPYGELKTKTYITQIRSGKFVVQAAQ